jgi:hypothetical protein
MKKSHVVVTTLRREKMTPPVLVTDFFGYRTER